MCVFKYIHCVIGTVRDDRGVDWWFYPWLGYLSSLSLHQSVILGGSSSSPLVLMEIDECATLEFFPFAAFVVLGSAIGSKFPFLKDRSRKSHIFSSPSFLFGWVEGWHLFSLHAVLRINTSVIFLCLSLLFWCLLVQKSFVWSPESKLTLFLLLVVASSLEWGRQVVTNLHFNQLYSFLLQFIFLWERASPGFDWPGISCVDQMGLECWDPPMSAC